MNTNIMPDENFKDYKIRLCKNKDTYNLSWNMIANLLNNVSGNNFGESTYRKWWKAYREGFDDKDRQNKEMNLDKIEVEKEKIKMYDQRRGYKKLLRENARFENLLDIVSDSLKNVEPIKYQPVFINTGITDNDIFVGLNDIHYGANINNHWNKYNPEIAKKRLEKYLHKIMEIGILHKSENCYVCCNGDLISGNIHKTIEVSNCENLVEQIKGVSELLSWFLVKLCERFNFVYFSVIPGNHSRVGKKDDSLKDERLDILIPWYIESRLSNIKNFKIIKNNIDNTMNMVNIRGKNYVNVHGDYDSFSNVQKTIDMIGEDVYCVHFGHKHHNAFDYNQKYKVIMSGSLMGMDDFCIEKRIYGKPQQLIGICTKDGMTCTYDIMLD